MKAFYFVFFILVSLVSCKSTQPQHSPSVAAVDSTTTTIKYVTKIDTVYVPGDSVRVYVPMADLSATPITASSKSGRVTASVAKQNSTLAIDCHIEEFVQLIESQNTIIDTLKKQKRTVTVTETVSYTPWYYKSLALVGGIFMLFMILGVVKTFLKPF